MQRTASDGYVAAFVSRCEATGRPVLSRPGLHGVLSAPGHPRTRLLVTDDRAHSDLEALLPAARDGMITVFATAARCAHLVENQPGWKAEGATAMLCRDISRMPLLTLPPELVLRPVRRRPEDRADGAALLDAVAVAVIEEPDPERSSAELAEYLRSLSPAFRLSAAVDTHGAVWATTGFGVFGAQATVIFVNTHPDRRRHGIGLAMTVSALRAACAAGAEQASLDASGAGRSIYRRLGFEVVAETLRFARPV